MPALHYPWLLARVQLALLRKADCRAFTWYATNVAVHVLWCYSHHVLWCYSHHMH